MTYPYHVAGNIWAIQPIHVSGSVLSKLQYYQELIDKYSEEYSSLYIAEVLREGGGTKFILEGDKKP